MIEIKVNYPVKNVNFLNTSKKNQNSKFPMYACENQYVQTLILKIKANDGSILATAQMGEIQ